MEAYDGDANAPGGPDGPVAPGGPGPAAAAVGGSGEPHPPTEPGRPSGSPGRTAAVPEGSPAAAAPGAPAAPPAPARSGPTGPSGAPDASDSSRPSPAGPSLSPPSPAGPSLSPPSGPSLTSSSAPSASFAPGGGAGRDAGDGDGDGTVRAGIDIAGLSPRYGIAALLALAVVAVVACVHVGMVFLHVAPSNTLTKQHGKAIDEWIYPEFEQNWKLFAPNPLQQNIAVQVRAETRGQDGSGRTTGWYDLSAQDGRAIDGNLLPSHTEQNELRRGFDFYVSSHDQQNRPIGLRGTLSQQYLRRIVVLRLDRGQVAGPGGAVERVQVRVRTAAVPPPAWSGERASATASYRTLPWWSVPAGEAAGGVG
nr:hypothetical protein StreXyl84_31940 [Streptomyces sp. Xyl84]